MRIQTLYDLLGVDRSATLEEIRDAFRQRAHETHPDKGGDHEAFIRLREAFEILSDPDKRRAYDARHDVTRPTPLHSEPTAAKRSPEPAGPPPTSSPEKAKKRPDAFGGVFGTVLFIISIGGFLLPVGTIVAMMDERTSDFPRTIVGWGVAGLVLLLASSMSWIPEHRRKAMSLAGIAALIGCVAAIVVAAMVKT